MAPLRYTLAGNPEWDKVIDHGPPEVNSEPPVKDQVKQHPTVPGMYSGPPERDKVINPGPPEQVKVMINK